MFESNFIDCSLSSELVSVIIPSYNSSQYISKAIESVLNQTYKHIELIIIDDGSTDNTNEIIAKYNDKLIYYYQENSGPAKARNIGVSLCRGNYVAFLDADDYWDKTKLEKTISIFNCRKDVGIVCSNLKYVDLKGNIIHLRRLGDLSSEEIKYKMYQSSLISPITAVFKKQLFVETGGFDQALKFAEDWDLFFKMTRKCDIYAIDEYLSYYVIHSNSMMRSSKYKELLLENSITVIKRMYIDSEECNDTQRSDEAVSNYKANFTGLCISEGNSDLAIKLAIPLLIKNMYKPHYYMLLIKAILCKTTFYRFLRYIKGSILN